MGMEVLVGPTFGIDVRSRSGVAVVPAAAEQRVVATCLFLKDGVGSTRDEAGSVFGIDQAGKPAEPEEDSSDCTSSIGAASEDEDNDEVTSKDVQSGFTGGVFGSFGSLEDSLPIKRGLSNHFTGKSKSFANLSEVCNVKDVKDLEKPENAFNKRRRLLVATKLCSKRSSFYGSLNPKSMPLLALKEDEDEDEDEDEEQQQQQQRQQEERQGHSLFCSPSTSPSSSSSSSEKKEQEYYGEHQQRLPKKLHHRRLLNFKSRSCFSLSDLQEHDEQDEDD